MSDKQKFPRADAIAVAKEMVAALKSCCVEDRLVIAGSLRRSKQTVGDVELLFISKIIEVPDHNDLFGPPLKLSTVDEALDLLLASGVIDTRPNKLGRTSWGDKNKLGIHVASGIPVDFFATNEECFYMALVIRTGTAEFNKRMILSAERRGLKTHAYGVFENARTGEKIIPKNEREVLELAGLRWIEPHQRF